MNAQGFPGKVQLQIYTGIPLDVEGYLRAVKPVGVAPAILPVTQRLPPIHRTSSIVLLPQMLERFAFLSQ